ncbi:MAG: Protein TusB [Pseudomonas citronellolis]|nr:MAG: Protein TusB [Pseudomonas citronellolis]
MSTLHLLSHSPFGDTRLHSCLRLMAPGDGLLLSGDAVYALRPGTEPFEALQARPQDCALFVLGEDLEARGLPPVDGALDYPGFVELCGQYDKVNSWL